jgi:isopenicillin N synthase-like dioxygenase
METALAPGHVPVVDLSPLDGSSGVAAAEHAVAELGRAASSEGIAIIIGHGVDPRVLERARERAKAFFDLSLEQKMRVASIDGMRGYRPLPTRHGASDRKETYFCELGMGDVAPLGSPLRGENIWPELDGFVPAMSECISSLVRLGQRVIRAFERNLGAPGQLSPGFERQPCGGLRLLRYPAAVAGDGWLGANVHIDLPAFAFLHFDDTPGLEWRDRAEVWHAIEPLDGGLLLQVGALLGRWTNGVYRPNVHRVALRSPKPRDSLALFFQPALETEVRCLDSCCGPENPARNSPISYAAYMSEWLEGMAGESRRGALLEG